MLRWFPSLVVSVFLLLSPMRAGAGILIVCPDGGGDAPALRVTIVSTTCEEDRAEPGAVRLAPPGTRILHPMCSEGASDSREIARLRRKDALYRSPMTFGKESPR